MYNLYFVRFSYKKCIISQTFDILVYKLIQLNMQLWKEILGKWCYREKELWLIVL